MLILMEDPYKIIEGCLIILEGSKESSIVLEILFSDPFEKKKDLGISVEFEKNKFNLQTYEENGNIRMTKIQLMKYVKKQVLVESIFLGGSSLYLAGLYDNNKGVKDYAAKIIQKQFRRYDRHRKNIRNASKQLKNAGVSKEITNAFNMLLLTK